MIRTDVRSSRKEVRGKEKERKEEERAGGLRKVIVGPGDAERIDPLPSLLSFFCVCPFLFTQFLFAILVTSFAFNFNASTQLYHSTLRPSPFNL
jgi:hypothetical protein